MEIPKYKAKALYAHVKRVVDNATFNPSDSRTADAMRLLKSDVRMLKKLIDDAEKQSISK